MLARRSILVLLAASTLVTGLATSAPAYAVEPTAAGPTASGPSHAGMPSRDRTAPGPVTRLKITGNTASSTSLSWVNPSDPDFAGVLIRRAAGDTPPIAASDGTLVATLSSRQTTFTDQHLTAASAYSYAVFGRDKSQNAGIATVLSTTTRSASTATGVQGLLTNQQGRAISKAQVEIREASSGNAVAVAGTAGNGQFSATGLAPGSYLLCVQPGNQSAPHSGTGYLPDCNRPQQKGHTGTPVTVLAGQMTTSQLDDPDVGGAISGRVTDSAGQGLAGVLVSSFDPSTPEYGPYVALTEQDGTYTVTGLAAGSYQVCFYSQGASGPSATGYLGECHVDQPLNTNSATPVSVSLGQTSAGIDAALAVAGAITGQITDLSSAPVTDVDVVAWVHGVSQFAGSTRSVSSGTYTVKGLPTGDYTLCFDGSYAVSTAAPHGHVTSCDGDAVAVVAGQATTVNKTVETAGAVGGSVTGDSGPVAGVLVSVSDGSGSQLSLTNTDSLGGYRFNGLAPGQVTVCFEPTYTAGGYQPTCYGAQPDGSGSPITVTAAALSTADVQLQVGASITGAVTDSSGAAISGVLVSAFGTSANYGYSAQTDETGSYTFSGVTADDYQLCLDPSYAQAPTAAGYAAECHSNRSSFETADPITVGASGSVTVDAALSPGATVSGQITGSDSALLGGVYVYAYAPASGQYVSASSDPTDGSYRLAGLAGGDYTLCFDATNVGQPAVTGYVNECHDNQGSPLMPIVAGTATAGIDAELAIGAGLSGQVTDSLGAGIPNAYVDTYGPDGSNLGPAGFTDSAGHYQLAGLPATAVRVCFHPGQDGGANGAGHLAECYDNQPDLSTADPVTTTASLVSAGIDAVLADAPA